MAISFNTLPEGKPGFTLVEKGNYKALIEKAEMKVSQSNPNNPPYLNLFLALTKDGKPAGKIFDILTTSTNEYSLYKLKRFIMALEIPMDATSTFELKDICKIAQGKEIYVDVTIDDKQDPAKSVVDIFSNEVYYPLEGVAKETVDTTQDIDAFDAEDVVPMTEAPADDVKY